MFHYARVVAETMPLCHGSMALETWRRTMPQLAFESVVMLNPLLAMAALHLHVEDQGNELMAGAFAHYLGRTLAVQRDAVQLMDKKDLAEPVWLAAMMLTNMYWLCAHHREPGEAYRLPSAAWDMISNVQRLFVDRYEALKRLGYAWCGLEFWPDDVAVPDLPGTRALKDYRAAEEDLGQLLAGFGVEAMSSELRHVYEDAAVEVLACYRCFYAGQPSAALRRRIGLLIAKCGPRYRCLMDKHDPLALALFARCVCLLAGFESLWWMNGKGAYEVMEATVYGVGRLMPEGSKWCMMWPKRVIRGDTKLLRAVEQASDV